jgi:hypothetical protein
MPMDWTIGVRFSAKIKIFLWYFQSKQNLEYAHSHIWKIELAVSLEVKQPECLGCEFVEASVYISTPIRRHTWLVMKHRNNIIFIPTTCEIAIVCIIQLSTELARVHGGAVGWGTILQVGMSWVRFKMRSLDFSIDLILPATLYPWGRLNL